MKKKLLVIDGSSYVHRAYHALPKNQGYTDDNGFHPTGAIRGVINMLNSTANKFPTDLRCCVFDTSRRSFRTDIFPQYKANRPPLDSGLVEQIKDIHLGVKLLGWDVILPENVEADDAIGTLAYKALEKGYTTLISSGDKDMSQLVCEEITVYDSMTKRLRDVEGVISDFGIHPSQIRDYLVLVGDVADNIPGVPKVGPKTAAALLSEYGTLTGIVTNIVKIKGRVGINILKSVSQFELTTKLVSIKTDVEGLPDINDLYIKQGDVEKFREFCKKRKLFSLLETEWW